MRATVAECLEVYKAELRQYVAWTNEMKEQYGPNRDALLEWGRTDSTKCLEWNQKLKGMVQVLGLTKREEQRIDRECGVAPPTKRKRAA